MARVALVTGGTRGIGRAIAVGLKQAGYVVAANYAGNEENAKAFAQETGIGIFKFDVGNYDAVTAGLAEVEKRLGPVEILVNNAGITRDGFLHKMPPSQWQEVIETNLTSLYNVTRAVINGMRERGFGRIINIASINGQKGQLGQTNYAAAKAGMIGFTKALAIESATKGITVNAIAPGYIETEMTGALREDILKAIIAQIPVGRMGKPEEVTGLVVYLASDVAAFCTGATFSINGGQYMS
jgi:acetoacetyl-CoA reductase